MDHPPTRQVIGKIPSRPLGPREALNLDAGALGFGGLFPRSRGQFLELQLHLIDQALAALGTRTERFALHLGNHELKMLDHCLGARQPGVRFGQRRLERFHVIGKLIRCRRHRHKCTTIEVIRRSKISDVSQRVALRLRRELSPLPLAATCAAERANRFLQAGSRVGPA